MRWIALQACITEPVASMADEATVQHAMASLALGWTPRVTLLDEAVLMDVTGSLRLFGGLARLMQLLRQRLTNFLEFHQASASVFLTEGATSLIALGKLRWQRSNPASTLKVRAGSLPMRTLSAARPHLNVLERTGCRTWDDLLKLPRDGVARRFGADLLAALDRARGSVPDTYDWLVLPEQFEEKIELDALVTHGPALMAGVQRLLVSLQAWLLGRQHGLNALNIIWHFDKRRDAPPTGSLVVRTDQSAQDVSHITRLVAEHLARQTLTAPVHSLTVQSLVTEPLNDAAAATHSLLIEDRLQGCSVVALVERLSARLSREKVRVWRPCANHRPEDMQDWQPAQSAIESIVFNSVKVKTGPRKGSKNKTLNLTRLPHETAARADALYPSWLLPEPMALRTVGNSPVYQGKLQRLAGPQRLESCGWLMRSEGVAVPVGQRLRPPVIRDYFIYRSELAGLLWIYSERLAVDAATTADLDTPPRRAWFLHGFFA